MGITSDFNLEDSEIKYEYKHKGEINGRTGVLYTVTIGNETREVFVTVPHL
jgi:hypothetical protein